MKTNVCFVLLNHILKNLPLRFQKRPVTLEKHFLVLNWRMLALALTLKTCQDCGFLSQASGSTLGLAPGSRNLFSAFDHDSLPYMWEAYVFSKLFIYLTFVPPFFLFPAYFCVARFWILHNVRGAPSCADSIVLAHDRARNIPCPCKTYVFFKDLFFSVYAISWSCARWGNDHIGNLSAL